MVGPPKRAVLESPGVSGFGTARPTPRKRKNAVPILTTLAADAHR
jgi:hypothetical protein